MKDYQPSQKILENYADVMVNFALGSGKGIKKGETVYLIVPEYAKPLLIELEKAIFKAGGNLILRYVPDNTNRFGFGREFYEHASDTQLSYFPSKYIRGLVDEADHVMVILGQTNMKPLEGIDSKKNHESQFGLQAIHGLAQRKRKCR